METRITQNAAEAVAWLERGDLVALPTETVYGLAADALNPDAVLRIFEAKERPHFDPLIVHLPDLSWLEKVADSVPEQAQQLAAAFWPGPFTMVLPRTKLVPDLVASGLPTVAVRMSAHPVFQEVIEAFGKPLAAPSANRFGRISPTSAAHVLGELGGRIPLIVDGGNTTHGIESTIVRFGADGRIEILRSGPVTREMLEGFGSVGAAGSTASLPVAPGLLKTHYAPVTPMRFLLPDEPPTAYAALLAWCEPRTGYAACEVLSPAGDLREAAATLFSKMRILDANGTPLIIAEPVPDRGLGTAIMDRLRKACGLG